MEFKSIYIRLLDEGTEVFRPVQALKITETVYKIAESEIYDRDDEVWEFESGDKVLVEEQTRIGKIVLIAIEKC